MRFPQAQRITYSTCSVHFEENESVVFQALQSAVAKERGWTILRREQQVSGLKTWSKRGIRDDGKLSTGAEALIEAKEEILDACIRCEKGTENGTMGFFVAAFARDGSKATLQAIHSGSNLGYAGLETEENEDEWNGFSDEDANREDTADDARKISVTWQSTSTQVVASDRKKRKEKKKQRK
jgi:putative methyltransferase